MRSKIQDDAGIHVSDKVSHNPVLGKILSHIGGQYIHKRLFNLGLEN